MNQSSPSRIPTKIWLFLALLLYIALWFLYPQEYIASDPGAYSAHAFAISESFEFGNSDVFGNRLGVTIPVAFLYSIFGVNVITTNLWPLFAALIVVITVWLALPDNKSKIVGALLCLTSIPLFDASIALYPDIIAAAFMASSSLILFNRQQFVQNQRTWLLTPLAAIALLFFAFLAKESAYWVLPLWVLALFSDLKDKDRNILLRRFHLPALGAGVFLGALYLVFCYAIWEDPFARLHSIQAMTGQHLWSWDKAPAEALVKRLTIAPISLFLSQYGAPTSLLAILGIVIAPRSIRPWGYYVVFCLLFFWFGSTSFTRYEPMPLVDRMTMPLLPALYVLAAFTISRLSITLDRATSINLFVPILLVLGFSGWSFAQYVAAWKGAEVPESVAIGIVKHELKQNPDLEYLLVCADTRSPEILSFYFGYHYPKNLHVVFAGNLTDELISKNRTFIFVDRQRSAFLKSAHNGRTYDNEIDLLGLVPIYKSDSVELLASKQEDVLKKLIPLTTPIENKKL